MYDPGTEQQAADHSEMHSATLDLYDVLQKSTSKELARTKTSSWRTQEFAQKSPVPDSLAQVVLPGQSPLARGASRGVTQTQGLQDLATWYADHPDGGSKKYSLQEWNACRQHVRQSAVHRHRMSSTSRRFASQKRSVISGHLQEKSAETRRSLQHRIMAVEDKEAAVMQASARVATEIESLRRGIRDHINYLQTQFVFPHKCNVACLRFRDGRIGIDRVVDDVEIALCKERDMLENSAEVHLKPTLADAEGVLASLEACKTSLDDDGQRKRIAARVDGNAEVEPVCRCGRLWPRLEGGGCLLWHFRVGKIVSAHAGDCAQVLAVPSTQQHVESDAVQVRPPDAVDVGTWEAVTHQLVDDASGLCAQGAMARRRMRTAQKTCTAATGAHQAMCSKAFARSVRRAAKAVADDERLIAETTTEITTLKREIGSLQELIESQEIPLKIATNRLRERTARPGAERTMDRAHKALIQEVAELNAAVAALKAEMDTTVSNLRELYVSSHSRSHCLQPATSTCMYCLRAHTHAHRVCLMSRMLTAVRVCFVPDHHDGVVLGPFFNTSLRVHMKLPICV
eukprot:m.282140 g.282140  ORF g.282140 m.282140 type:complete len:571 (-) comp19843_c0_seq1:124-1836(-)